MRYVALACTALVAITFAGHACAAEYETRTFTAPDAKTQPYRLLKPDSYDKSRRYPLVLLLHGFGERGTDNEKPVKSDSNGAGLFTKAAIRKEFPCFVIVPQAGHVWVSEPDFHRNTPFQEKPQDSIRLTGQLVAALMKEFSIDADRFYLMGYSNGGCGVWDLLVRAPKLVAAAVVKSGAGDPSRIAVAKPVPVWVFHGAKDETVPVARAHDMVAALKKAGGHVFYTEYASASHHDAATKAHHESELLPWIFAQRRGKPAVDPKSLKKETPKKEASTSGTAKAATGREKKSK